MVEVRSRSNPVPAEVWSATEGQRRWSRMERKLCGASSSKVSRSSMPDHFDEQFSPIPALGFAFGVHVPAPLYHICVGE